MQDKSLIWAFNIHAFQRPHTFVCQPVHPSSLRHHGCNVSLIFPPFLLSFGNYGFTLGKYCFVPTCMKLVVNSYLVDDWWAMSAFSAKGSQNMSHSQRSQAHCRNTWSLWGDVWCWIAFGKNRVVPNMFSKFSRFVPKSHSLEYESNLSLFCLTFHIHTYVILIQLTCYNAASINVFLMLFNLSQILKADFF